MERICPFLALEGDARTVVAGFDPEHRCRAVSPEIALERAQQLSVCLEPAHSGCPRYVAAIAARGTSPQGTPAPDAMLGSTRLVLEPEATVRLLRRASPGPAPRRWALGGVLALVGVIAVAGGVTGALGSLPSVGLPSASRGPTPDATPAASSQPVVASASPGPSTPTTTPTASPRPGTATPATPQPTTPPTEAPQQRTYVVQPGDTLHAIAVQFGTTVDALQRANGLADSNLIVVGQRLVIP
jgi:LysM repeat protein